MQKNRIFALCIMALAAASSFAASSNQIIVAQVAPFSGVQGQTGSSVHAGARLYFDYINSKGGIDGKKIVFVSQDDEYKPEKAVEGVKKLIETHSPVLFINTIGTASTQAILKSDALKRTKVSLLGPATGAQFVSDSENVFPIRVSYNQETLTILKHVSLTNPKRIAVWYQNDSYGSEVLASIKEHMKSFPSMALVRAEPYDPRGASFTAGAVAIADQKPDIVFLAAVTKPAVSFIRDFRKISPLTSVVAMSPVDPEVLLKDLKPEEYTGVLVGSAYPHPKNSREPIVAEMHKVQKTMGREEATSPRYMEGYMTAKTAVLAIKRAAKPLTPESVTKALSGISFENIGGAITVNYADGKKGLNYVDIGMIGKTQFVQ